MAEVGGAWATRPATSSALRSMDSAAQRAYDAAVAEANQQFLRAEKECLAKYTRLATGAAPLQRSPLLAHGGVIEAFASFAGSRASARQVAEAARLHAAGAVGGAAANEFGESVAAFFELVCDLDELRRWVLERYLGLKHALEVSALAPRRAALLAALNREHFMASRTLGGLVTETECFVARVLCPHCHEPPTAAAATAAAAERARLFECGLCRRTLTNPVVLACGHRFCFCCAAARADSGQQCPTCSMPISLDRCRVDGVLQRFIAEHLSPAPAGGCGYCGDAADAFVGAALGSPPPAQAEAAPLARVLGADTALREGAPRYCDVHDMFEQPVSMAFMADEASPRTLPPPPPPLPPTALSFATDADAAFGAFGAPLDAEAEGWGLAATTLNVAAVPPSAAHAAAPASTAGGFASCCLDAPPLAQRLALHTSSADAEAGAAAVSAAAAAAAEALSAEGAACDMCDEVPEGAHECGGYSSPLRFAVRGHSSGFVDAMSAAAPPQQQQQLDWSSPGVMNEGGEACGVECAWEGEPCDARPATKSPANARRRKGRAAPSQAASPSWCCDATKSGECEAEAEAEADAEADASSSDEARLSCHQCKVKKPARLFAVCNPCAQARGLHRCRKKFCDQCLRNCYGQSVAQIYGPAGFSQTVHWECPSCRGVCICAKCTRARGEGAPAAPAHHHVHQHQHGHHAHHHAHHHHHHHHHPQHQHGLGRAAATQPASPGAEPVSPPQPGAPAEAAAPARRVLTGSSCHQCKNSMEPAQLMACTNIYGPSRQHCRKKYCARCLAKYEDAAALEALALSPAARAAWVCPSCKGQCTCAGCKRNRG